MSSGLRAKRLWLDYADAISWLREQERMLNTNPQFSGIDVRPLWAELGLEYQGLDTD